MSAKIYWTTSNQSLRNIKKYLTDNEVEYTAQSIETNPLSWEQLLEILMYSENGLEDMISWRSNSYTKLMAQGVVFDDLTLTEFHKLIVEHPRLLRLPILVAKSTTFIGFSENDITVLMNKKTKKESYREVLNALHASDKVEYYDDVYV